MEKIRWWYQDLTWKISKEIKNHGTICDWKHQLWRTRTEHKVLPNSSLLEVLVYDIICDPFFNKTNFVKLAWVFIGEKVEDNMDNCLICVCFGLFGEREIKGYSKMWVIGATAQILFLCIIFWIMLVIVHMRHHCLCWILSIGWALSKRKEYSISLFILSLYDIPLYISYILCALFLKRFLLIYIFCLLIKKTHQHYSSN